MNWNLNSESKDNADVNEELVNWIKINKFWDIMKEKIMATPLSLENPNVQRVIAIAEDMMNQNKILTIERLFNVSKKVLKIPRSGLISIIHFLINKHVLLEGTKFSREMVLNNRLRKNILEYIQFNGCAHFSILRKKVLSERDGNLGSSGQLVWHLEMLIKFNYIKKIKVGNNSVFLPYEEDEKTAKVLFLVKDRINKEIFELLGERGPVKKADIHKEIDERREDVYYRINNLINQNLLKYDQVSKEISLYQKDKKKIDEVINRELRGKEQ
ncbi:MAG: hypothetical protein ACTSP9_07270 [Promethearchaeota archaeon]